MDYCDTFVLNAPNDHNIINLPNVVNAINPLNAINVINDPIICTEKSFFENPARHLPARALQWQAGRFRSGEAGGSESFSYPEPVLGD
jgi:hypothetical protein